MQSNSITLAVDLANSGSTTNKVYSRFEEQVNKTTYNGPGHTLSERVTMQFYRTLPKRAGNFLGSAKTAVKFTFDKKVDNADGTGELVAPLIVECSFSVPVGVSPADTVILRQTLLAILDRDDVMAALNDTQEI
jgi:hypothetical protein